MKKCYIAGKVTGLSEEDYKAKFRRAEIAVTILGYDPVNPCELEHDHDKSWLSYMRYALVEFMGCDMIYALPDWEDSRGARIEIQLAKDLGIPIIFENITQYVK